MRPRLLLLAVLLPGCAITSMLPNVQTGKCYEVVYSHVDWLYVLAEAVDGWRCEGLAVGDTPRPEDGPRPVKPVKSSTASRWPPVVAVPVAPVAAPSTEPTWATGY